MAAYPHLSCTKKQLQVPNTWGVFEDVYCAGNEETFSFMEKVMDEVMALFPGQYIHIGGDECPKTRWQECSKCQQKIKEEGLENEEELQSYFIKRVERYLNAHGRQIIGWDEILEGGLAPEATVMSWRGEQGGIQAAQQEHQVIMTPNSHCYFDHYQADPAFEPKAIGGFTPLNKVYNYEPIPTDLSEEQAKYIWGAQGNMWTEYMPNSSQVEYMLLPRMIALSEVLWSRKEYKDYLDFNKRLQSHKNLLQKLGYQYSKGSYKINLLTKYDTTNHTYKAEFVNEQHQAIIRYTLDNTMPNDSSLQFDSAFIIKHSCLITAAIFEQGELMRSPSKFQYEHHIGVGKQIELLKKPSLEYGGKVETILLDGLQGSSNSYKDSWLAFKGKDLLAKIDLKQKYPLNQLSFSFINKPDHNILAPISATIFTSEDGERFLEYKYEEIAGNTQQLDTIMGKFVIALPSDSIRYLKIRIENAEVTDTHNNGAWLLIDELVIK
ncbi:MAG: hypothetical protein B7C24_07515 [Bacteroidetes bacterium 4572_77]|nr:MAG: hypothetical protein B7C24_07515 [Bacteroidetes bacterium 4572_77]